MKFINSLKWGFLLLVTSIVLSACAEDQEDDVIIEDEPMEEEVEIQEPVEDPSMSEEGSTNGEEAGE